MANYLLYFLSNVGSMSFRPTFGSENNPLGLTLHLCHVLERGGVDGRAGQVVEGERLVHILDVHEQLEDPDVVLETDPLRRLPRSAAAIIAVTLSAAVVTVALFSVFLPVPVFAVSNLARNLRNISDVLYEID